MSYLRGVGAAEETGAGDITAAIEGGPTCLVARGGATTAEGKEGLTQGLKEELCPPRVFAMSKLGVGEEEWRRNVFSPEKTSSGNGLKRNRMEVRDIYRGLGKVKGL